MLTHHHHQIDVSASRAAIKWLVIFIIATVILSFALSAAGHEEPQKLPIGPAAPMPAQTMQDADENGIDRLDQCELLWQAVEQIESGDWKTAATSLQVVRLEPHREAWRQIFLAGLDLKQQNLTAAMDHLNTARGLAPQNAVVHFFQGELWRARAAGTHDFMDGPIRSEQIASTDVFPALQRHAWRQAAIDSFEAVIQLAPKTRTNVELVPTWWGQPTVTDPRMPVVAPAVGEMLEAFGIDNITVTAHQRLAVLFDEQGEHQRAEQHRQKAMELQNPRIQLLTQTSH